MDNTILDVAAALEYGVESFKGAIKDIIEDDCEFFTLFGVYGHRCAQTGKVYHQPRLTFFQMSYSTEEERESVRKHIREALVRAEGIALFMATTSWVLSTPPEVTPEYRQRAMEMAAENRLREHPDSVETAILLVETYAESTLHSAPIFRDGWGASLGPWEQGALGATQGFWSNLLPNKGPIVRH